LTQRKSYRINNLAAKTRRSNVLSGWGCCEGTQPQCFEKGGFYQRLGDICIGSIENTEFWVDKDLFEYWKHSHFTLDVIDALE
jgi:uncharacterized protein (DUF779 family)